jgi:hypothetical protein
MGFKKVGASTFSKRHAPFYDPLPFFYRTIFQQTTEL